MEYQKYQFNPGRFARLELLVLDPFEKPTLKNKLSTLYLNTICRSISVLSPTLDRLEDLKKISNQISIKELALAGLVLFGGQRLINDLHQNLKVADQNPYETSVNHAYQENDYLTPLNIIPTALPTPEPTPIPTSVPTTPPGNQPLPVRVNPSIVPAQESKVDPISRSYTGLATIYSRNGCIGCRADLIMANGKRLVDSDLTIATNLPFALNEVVLIINLRTGAQAKVTVTDRGGNGIADLTPGTASLIGWQPGDKVEISSPIK